MNRVDMPDQCFVLTCNGVVITVCSTYDLAVSFRITHEAFHQGGYHYDIGEYPIEGTSREYMEVDGELVEVEFDTWDGDEG